MKNAISASPKKNFLPTNYYNIFVIHVIDLEVVKELEKNLSITYLKENLFLNLKYFEILLQKCEIFYWLVYCIYHIANSTYPNVLIHNNI
jgi:hypothetical protein